MTDPILQIPHLEAAGEGWVNRRTHAFVCGQTNWNILEA